MVNKFFRAKPFSTEGLDKKKVRLNNGWVEGVPAPNDDSIFFAVTESGNGYVQVRVKPETLGQYSCMNDEDGNDICEGDIVRLVGEFIGKIVYTAGAFCVHIRDNVDYDYLASEIAPITGCNNSPRFCYNDNVVSLYELYENFNGEEDVIPGIVVLGNIHEY